MKLRPILLAFILLLAAIPAFASSSGSVMEIQTALVIQIGVVLFVVKLGGIAAQRLKMPSVLGELLAGVAIGPYALGGLAIPGFPAGLFATGALGAELPISPELYGIATIASIILLFESGLETDLSLFLKYSVAGGVVGIGGVIASFLVGDVLGMVLFGGGFMAPGNLFLGIMSTATSVGITARILSDRKKMDSPEGVTILAAAVFDDVLGIIFLAVVMGIAAIGEMSGGGLDWGKVGLIALRAFGIWLGFTVLGLVLAKRIASVLKRFKHASAFTVLSLGLALIIAGIFEKEGLAMIIGAYVVGLALSKTDISHIIIDKIHVLYDFFVPVFFAVMGMLVDVRQFLSPTVIVGGLVFTVLAVLSKVIGCGLPALFVGFNLRGAARIGVGMVPRGEVALIIAGIGMASGILTAQGFGMAIMMTLLTTVIAPFALNVTLKSPLPGAKKKAIAGESLSYAFPFPSEDLALLVTDTMTHHLQSEGFYVRTMGIEEGIAQVRKADLVFSMRLDGDTLAVQASQSTMPVVLTSVFEAVAALNNSFGKLKSDFDPASLSKLLLPESAPLLPSEAKVIDRSCILLDLKGESKDAVIKELLDALEHADKISDRALAEEAIMERERSMSTGMQHGIAVPHAKTDGVDRLAAAIGIKRGGMDFQSLDGEPTHIIVLSVSPKKHPESHMQFLAAIGSALGDKTRRDDILNARSEDELSLLLGL
jgi:Kef-type K+ transport system membrane component KefB/mannitol/fructose-specific phosphotransferase system IIA component (Ntr-type)